MKHWLRRTVVAIAILVLPVASAFGQTSTISGVVTDSGGGVIPGADVVIKHTATGVTTSAVSNAEGAFSFPGVQTGTYTVTVSLAGFKTFVANDVVLTSGTPASVRAVLEIGGLSETVTVSSSSEIIQTQAATISSTVTMNEITKLPITSRSAMDFIPFLPGVSTPGGNRQSQINGLPRGQINITLDGVNIQDNTLRTTDGFFAIVSPRLDAIEEVTLTTASQGSGDTGQGAVQVKFVTRSGTNSYTGSAYTTYRSDKFNANTWFNNRDGVDKAQLTQHQPGGRVGGPIIQNKAFFFVNYEEERVPRELTRTRTIFHPRAEQGIYRYTAAGGTREVNLLALAAANGQLTTVDPIVGNLLSKIRSATGTTGSVTDNTDPLTQTYRYNVPVDTLNRFPTFRVDYNLTNAHRVSTAWNYNRFNTFPDTLNSREARFPGFPVAAGQSSTRLSWSNSLRSTFGTNFVNEARVAYASSPVVFFKELGTAAGFNREIFSEEGGFRLDFPIVTEPSAPPAPQGRNAWNLLFEDSISWLKGNHSITAGGSLTHFQTTSYNSSLVPEIDFEVLTGDPALSMFTGAAAAANFPGASTGQINAARQMYALFTGRVSSIDGNARLENGQYVYMGNAQQDGVMREAGFFIQDSWRMKPNFTLNFGLRYELQFPFYPLNDSYSTATFDSLCGVSGVNNRNDVERACNLFQPGQTPGVTPEYINFGKGERSFNLDKNNWAPSVGFAWVLGQKDGWLGGLLGDDAVLRAGYSKSYSREGLTNYTTRFSANPGLTLANEPDRNLANNNLGALPLLLRQAGRLGPGSFPEAPSYPFTGSVNDSINRFFDGIQVPWAESVSVGLQRALGNTHAVEIRYVGTRSRDGWTTYNYNEANIVENGFLDEFRAAQANLQANITAGRGATFRYFGAGTGTSPLPIYLAYLVGRSDATNPAAYTGTLWGNSNFVNPLNRWNPNIIGTNPAGPASANANAGLYGSPVRRANAVAAGLPANFFVANPDKLGGAVMTGNGGKTHYNALQLEFRRRLHQGLQFNTSYAFGEMYGSERFSFRKPRLMRRDTGSPGDITHAFKLNLVYDLPFGQGRKFASNAGGVTERIVGGWSFGLTGIVRSGTLVNLGNVRLVGMTADDVGKMFQTRIDTSGDVYMLPKDVIDETIKAFSVSATSPTGYGSLGAPSGRYFAPANGPDCIEIAPGFGDCGTGDLVVTGPMFQQFDIAVSKRVALFGRSNLEFRVEALNAFNHHNFDPANYVSTNPVGGVGGTNLTNYELDGLLGTNTSRLVQFIARFNF